MAIIKGRDILSRGTASKSQRRGEIQTGKHFDEERKNAYLEKKRNMKLAYVLRFLREKKGSPFMGGGGGKNLHHGEKS